MSQNLPDSSGGVSLAGALAPHKPPNGHRGPGDAWAGRCGNSSGATGAGFGVARPVDGPPETALGERKLPGTVERLHPKGESTCGGADQNLPDLSGGVSVSGELPASLLKLMAAFRSRSITRPHA